MSQQNCTNCGTSNALDTKFCTECGTQLITLLAKVTVNERSLAVSPRREAAHVPLIGAAGLIKNSNIVQNVYHQSPQKDPKEIYGEAVYGALQNKGVIDAAARAILKSLQAALSLTDFQTLLIQENAEVLYHKNIAASPPSAPAPPLSPTVARYHYTGPTGQKEGTEDEIVSWIMAVPNGEHHIWQAGWPAWKSWRGVDSLKAKIEKLLPPPAKPAIISLPVPALIPQTTPTPTPQKSPAEFVLIQPGQFMMGSPTTERGRRDNETQHQVEITYGFWMQTTPVTRQDWKSLMGNNPSHFKGDASRPIENISWFDAVAYCNALSRKEGLTEAYILANIQGHPGENSYTCTVTWRDFECNGYRLPTEAEWEYAARAGTTTAFYNGDCLNPKDKDTNLDQIAWYDQNSGHTTHPVKGKKPNLWGLYDMLGNVWEWCWDWFSSYSSGPQIDPKGPSRATSGRVVRGGSWNFHARNARTANRFFNSPGLRYNVIGFRPARSNCLPSVSTGYHYTGPTGQKEGTENEIVSWIMAAPTSEHRIWQEGWPAWRSWRGVDTLKTKIEKLSPTPPKATIISLPSVTLQKSPEEFILIQPGRFMMGSPTTETGRRDNETQHEVEITRGFWMQTTPVTQDEWQTLMGNNPSHFKGDLNRPVEMVSWFDAVAYCNALSLKEGLTSAYALANIQGRPGENGYTCAVTWRGFECDGYRLPTEAEWEYAARAGTTTAFYNGDCLNPKDKDTNLDRIAWYDQNSRNTTHPVKAKKPNPWGLYDMLGNNWEWCWDWFSSYPSGSQSDPIGPSKGGSFRVSRGGSWYYFAQSCRAASRDYFIPGIRDYSLGLRLVRSNHLSSGSARYHYISPKGQKEGTEDEIVSWVVASPTSEHQIWQAGWSNWKSWNDVESLRDKIKKSLQSSINPEIIEIRKPIHSPQRLFAEFVPIQPGLFTMGSPSTEKAHSSDETQHPVQITQGFWMQATPVTQAQWVALMGNNPSHFKGDLNRPVETVSWFDAVTYCNELSRQEGFAEVYILENIRGHPGEKGYKCSVWKEYDRNGYRLPTEAEWEYACHAGTVTAFYSGDCLSPSGKDVNLNQIGWYDQNSDQTTHPVQGKQPNAWGLYDMLGNVCEWCGDWYGDYPSAFQNTSQCGGPSIGSYRVLRGGSWNLGARHCRVAYRNGADPGGRSNEFGFRPIRIIPSMFYFGFLPSQKNISPSR